MRQPFTELREAIIVDNHTPLVQTGKYGENLGKLALVPNNKAG